MASQLAGWPMPQAGTPAQDGYNEAGNTDAARRTVALVTGHVAPSERHKTAGWATPHEGDHRPGHETRMADTARINLMDQALLAGWATPLKSDGRGSPGTKPHSELPQQVAHVIPGASLNGLPAQTVGAGLLNPQFSLWLQGYPTTLLASAPLATPSTSKSRKRSSAHGHKATP
jgi:hypothetical protein